MKDLEALYDTPLLDHENRRDILRLLTEEPGMNRNQLQNAMGASLGVVDFHLGRLLDDGVVVRKPSANDKEVLLFTRQNEELWNNSNTRVLYGGEFTRNVALAILEEPGTTTNEISDLLDIEPVTVRYHLNKLKDNQLIGGIRVKNTVEYHPTRELMGWYEEMGDVYDRPWDEEGEGEDVEDAEAAEAADADDGDEQTAEAEPEAEPGQAEAETEAETEADTEEPEAEEVEEVEAEAVA